jgi:hypothetical protein
LETKLMMTRNEFLKWVGGGAALLSLAACDWGGGATLDAGPDAPAGCSATNAKVVIKDNHVHAPHVLVVSKEDIAAGVDKTYDIMGTAIHTHMVTVTAAQFIEVKTAPVVIMSTSVDGHMHEVTVSC